LLARPAPSSCTRESCRPPSPRWCSTRPPPTPFRSRSATPSVPASFSASGQELPLSVVGIAEPPEGAGFGGSSRVLVSQDSAETVLGPSRGTVTETWLATVPEGTDPAEVAATASSDEITVRTVEEAEEDAAGDFLQGFGALAMVLAVFVV